MTKEPKTEGIERATLTVEQAGKLLGISRGHAYMAANSGDIPTIRIGHKILVPRAALERMLAVALPPAAAPNKP